MKIAFRDLLADEIECRIQQIKEGTGRNEGKVTANCLLYKDARCDQRILDECVGPMNWQRHHLRDNANCVVSIWDDDKKQWIEKEDTGTESNTEAEKGLASDSFKRACFNWGIGRELYTAPNISIELTDREFSVDKGKPKSYAKFHVSDIKIADKKIVALTVADRFGKVRFEYKGEAKQKPAEQEEQKPFVVHICDRCGKKLVPVTKRDGTTWTVEDMANYSHMRFGSVMCADCQKITLKEEREAEKTKPAAGEQVTM